MIELELDDQKKQIVSIKAVGVGGAGGNAIKRIIDSGIQNIDCIVVNTDAQALELSTVATKVQIGIKSAKGLGTGANPELGKRAAEEDLDKIMEAIGNADIVFLAAGMGGGTGSGALPVIAHALREKGILSIAIITKPFIFEGKRRMNVAQEATEAVRKEVDTLIVMPNQNLLQVADKNVSMIDAFAMINDVLTQSVKGISDIITNPGHINVDCADVRAIMKDQGIAVMGTGRVAGGAGRGREAALQAISSPLLENMSIEGAHSVLLNITGGRNLGLHEISDAASVIYEQAHEDANIILGSVIDEAMGDELSVTIIATGFKAKEKKEAVSKDDSTPSRGEQTQPEPIVRGSVLDSFGMGLKEVQAALQQEVAKQAAVLLQEVAAQEAALQVEEPAIQQEAAPEAVMPQATVSLATKEAIVEHATHDLGYERCETLQDLDVPTYLRKQQEERL